MSLSLWIDYNQGNFLSVVTSAVMGLAWPVIVGLGILHALRF